jgi:hypothetical protein
MSFLDPILKAFHIGTPDSPQVSPPTSPEGATVLPQANIAAETTIPPANGVTEGASTGMPGQFGEAAAVTPETDSTQQVATESQTPASIETNQAGTSQEVKPL